METNVDALPPLESAYTVGPERIAAYQRDGHVLLRQVADADEVAAYRPHIEACVQGSGRGDVPLDQRDDYHKAFLQITNLWETSPAVARFTCARRFARIAAELMGADGVRLFHDQALFKEPGGGPTFWHQDQYYWPLATDKTITMWMPLVDVPIEMGVLTFASGSHGDGPVCDLSISSAGDAALRRVLEERQFLIVQEPLRAGDATFHAGWTLHTAPGNNTDRMREVMTIIYFADGTRIAEPSNPDQPADLARWLPGQQPGELAASELNPLLWHRERDGG
jgi:ectoine hydroxylase-related dioxygenase (phytanoyl-CoA dioxygenase family)